MSEQPFSTEEALPQITVGADGVLRSTVQMDVGSVESPAAYTPKLVEWFNDESTGEKVAAITTEQLRHFAVLRQMTPEGSTPDPVVGTKVAALLFGRRGLTYLGLGEYLAHGGDSAVGLNAVKLPDLVARLEADIHDDRKIHIRGIGKGYIEFLAEYCDSMIPKSEAPTP